MAGKIGTGANQSDKSKLPTNTDHGTEKPARKNRFNRVIQAIQDLQQWIKRVFINDDNSQKISSRKIGNIESDYIELTETIELTSAEFKKILKKGTFSNTTKYIVTGNVNINKYPCYYLPQHIKIIGDCTITKSSKLESFPYDFEVTGNVKVNKCKNFDIINNDKYKFKCGGKLTLSNLDSLTQLPNNINYDVHVYKCNNLRQLSAGNYQKVIIEKCNNFSIIEPSSYIKELSLISNKNFVEFLDDLTVGNLNIISCPITSLVNKVTIEGDLLLKNLKKLTKIYNSKVKLVGELTIYNCYKFLTEININGWPSWVIKYNLDDTVDANCRRVNIHKWHRRILIDSRLDIFPVNYIMKNFKRFSFTLDGLSKFFAQLAEDKNRNSWPYVNYKDKIPLVDRTKLYSFLYKVEQTNDFRTGDKHYLATQIVKILSLFEKGIDEDTYAQAMEIVDYATSSCTDRTILALDDLLILVQSKEAIQSGDFEKFKETIKYNTMIGKMDEESMKLKKGLQIENVLAYRLYLREKLRIEGGVQTMKFIGESYVIKRNVEQSLALAIATANVAIEKIKPSDMMLIKLTAIAPEELRKKQKTLIDYNKLTNIIEVDEMPECEILYDITDKMVKYGEHFYDYDAFFRTYQETGKDPAGVLDIEPKNIYKVVKKANPS